MLRIAQRSKCKIHHLLFANNYSCGLLSLAYMKKSKKIYVITNSVTLAVMLWANIAANAGWLFRQTVADVSHKYDTLFAPAGYAFIIWGFLFFMCICFVVFQWILLKENDPHNYIRLTGIWFSLSNISNAAWLYCWINEMLGCTVVIICFLLICLIILSKKLRLELDDEPVRTILFVWWPVTFYLGWIMVAVIACISAWLVSIGWEGGSLPSNAWTIILIAVACFLYLILIFKRNMREAAAVGVWAFIAISVRQWHLHFDIAVAALIASLILITVSAIHVNKNRYYVIRAKLKRGEWK